MTDRRITRRTFLKGAASMVGLLTVGCFKTSVNYPEIEGESSTSYTEPRVFAVGLDGARLSDLQDWAGQGLLPNIKRLLERGSFGKMTTTYPSVSPTAWTSLMMGTNPGKHGVYGFMFRQPGCYNIFIGMPGCAADTGQGTYEGIRTGAPLWTTLSERGYRVGVLLHPVAFPPDPVSGYLMSGVGTPGLAGSHVYYTDTCSALMEKTQLTGDPPYSAEIARPGVADAVQFEIDLVGSQVQISSTAFTPSQFTLSEGEWSGWVQVHFERYEGIVRFRPERLEGEALNLYLEPVEINPRYPLAPYVCFHPKELSVELCNEVGYFRSSGWRSDFIGYNMLKCEADTFLNQLYGETDETTNIASHLLSNYGGDYFFVAYTGTDRVSHMFWKEMLQQDDSTIRDYYQYVDVALGQLLDLVPADCVKMVISDHGFSLGTHKVYINAWLKAQGFLSLVDGAGIPTPAGLRYNNDTDVDWWNTQAFSYDFGKIRLNVDGREPKGCVAEADYDTVREAIIAALSEAPWVDQVFRREEVYWGSRVVIDDYDSRNLEAPDIVFTFRDETASGGNSYLQGDVMGMTFDFPDPVPNLDRWSGTHEAPFDPVAIGGTIIASGPGIRQNHLIQGARNIDFAPTVLHLLGEQPTAEMDGLPLTDILD